MDILVGHTGFVGSNLLYQYHFDYFFNSKNISNSYLLKPDLLVYAGIPGTKFIANKNPLQDFSIIKDAIHNIREISPKKLVLISTIDVYGMGHYGCEDKLPEDDDNITEYGKNRRYLERWIQSNMSNYHIIRLPGIYGENIRKNLIFDLIYEIPPILDEAAYMELCDTDLTVKSLYYRQDDSYYYVRLDNAQNINRLKKAFKKMGYSFLKHTDTRGVYQYYNLSGLWGDISTALKHRINVLNIATEPVTAYDIIKNATGEIPESFLDVGYPIYNMKTKYACFFGDRGDYMLDAEEVLRDIHRFVLSYKKRVGLETD